MKGFKELVVGMLAFDEVSSTDIQRLNNPSSRSRCWWEYSFTYIRTKSVDEEKNLYDIYLNGKFIKQFHVPEIYFKVMEDVENGRILQNNIEPSLRIKYTKKYDAYVKPQNK